MNRAFALIVFFLNAWVSLANAQGKFDQYRVDAISHPATRDAIKNKLKVVWKINYRTSNDEALTHTEVLSENDSEGVLLVTTDLGGWVSNDGNQHGFGAYQTTSTEYLAHYQNTIKSLSPIPEPSPSSCALPIEKNEYKEILPVLVALKKTVVNNDPKTKKKISKAGPIDPLFQKIYNRVKANNLGNLPISFKACTDELDHDYYEQNLELIAAVAKYLNDHPKIKFRLHGCTDEPNLHVTEAPEKYYKQKTPCSKLKTVGEVMEARNKAIRKYLSDFGVDPSRARIENGEYDGKRVLVFYNWN